MSIMFGILVCCWWIINMCWIVVLFVVWFVVMFVVVFFVCDLLMYFFNLDWMFVYWVGV